MALHPDFPASPHAVLEPDVRWFPADESLRKLTEKTSAKYTEQYEDFIHLGVIEWGLAAEEHGKLGKKAILLVMTDDTKNCDEVAAFLANNNPDLNGVALVIHTDKSGEISASVSGRGRTRTMQVTPDRAG